MVDGSCLKVFVRKIEPSSQQKFFDGDPVHL